MRRFVFCIVLACFSLSALAQLSDGHYHGFSAKDEDNIIDIYVTSFGDGVTQFGEGDKKKAINGKYHIGLGPRRYVLANFIKGIPNGEWTIYYDNHVVEQGTMKNGQFNGKMIEYDHYPTVIYEYDMVNGKKQHYTGYYANGQKKTEISYDENGKTHGNYKTYDINGKLVGDENYSHGLRDGSQLRIDSSGYKETFECKNGVNVGPYCRLYPNGNVHRKGNYDENGKMTGNWIFGEENGIITEDLNYIADEEQGEQKTYYVRTGALHTIKVIEGNRARSKYYNEEPNQIALEESYKDGRRDGIFRAYHGGVLWSEEVYKEGKQLSRTEYKNGKPAILYILDETDQLSVYKRYDETGKTTFKNKSITKSKTLVENESGVIDID